MAVVNISLTVNPPSHSHGILILEVTGTCLHKLAVVVDT